VVIFLLAVRTKSAFSLVYYTPILALCGQFFFYFNRYVNQNIRISNTYSSPWSPGYNVSP
jgi:hypothetical protein